MTYGPPEGKSFLGYDYIGHDVWSRVLAGGASIIWMTLAASLVALVIGSSLGILAAFARNKIDQFVTWLTDVLWPFLILFWSYLSFRC